MFTFFIKGSRTIHFMTAHLSLLSNCHPLLILLSASHHSITPNVLTSSSRLTTQPLCESFPEQSVIPSSSSIAWVNRCILTSQLVWATFLNLTRIPKFTLQTLSGASQLHVSPAITNQEPSLLTLLIPVDSAGSLTRHSEDRHSFDPVRPYTWGI